MNPENVRRLDDGIARRCDLQPACSAYPVDCHRTVVGGGDHQPLNLLLFGEEYAVTMGLNVRRSRGLLFLSTTLLAGTCDRLCGPDRFHRAGHAPRHADAVPQQ